MRQRIQLRSALFGAALAVAVFGLAGCGGGGSAGSDDLVLVKFLLVDENLNNIGGTGATNAFRDTRLLFEFNEPVDFSSVSDRTIKIGIPTGDDLLLQAVGRFEQVPGRPNQVVFDPTYTNFNQTNIRDNPFGLDANSPYEIQIPSVGDGPKHLMSDGGKPLVGSFTASFATGDDYLQNFAQPELVSTQPAVNETGVHPSADVLLEFDQPMRPDTFRLGDTVFVRDLDHDLDVLGQLRFSADAKTVTFRPVFGYGKGPNQIFVRVTTAASNLSGNHIPKEVRFTFITAHDPNQPDFGDITEDFEDNSHEDTAFPNTFPLARWNSGVTINNLAGVFTSGQIERAGTITTYTYPPFGWGYNFAAQWQYLIYANEVGGSRTIVGYSWYYNAQTGANTVTNVTVNMGHTQQGNLTTSLAANFSDTPVTVATATSYAIPNSPLEGWLPLPAFSNVFRYNGSDNMIVEIFNTNSANGHSSDPTAQSKVWYGLMRLITAPPNSLPFRAAYTQPPSVNGGVTTRNQYEYFFRLNYLIEQSEAQSKWYDSGLQNPQFLDGILFPSIQAQPAGTATTIQYQGALTDPLDPSFPDENTATNWTPDLTKLSGYRFVRFNIVLKGNFLTNQVPIYEDVILPYIFF